MGHNSVAVSQLRACPDNQSDLLHTEEVQGSTGGSLCAIGLPFSMCCGSALTLGEFLAFGHKITQSLSS